MTGALQPHQSPARIALPWLWPPPLVATAFLRHVLVGHYICMNSKHNRISITTTISILLQLQMQILFDGISFVAHSSMQLQWHITHTHIHNTRWVTLFSGWYIVTPMDPRTSRLRYLPTLMLNTYAGKLWLQKALENCCQAKDVMPENVCI